LIYAIYHEDCSAFAEMVEHIASVDLIH